MRLPTYPSTALAAFARLHNVQFNGTSISRINPEIGLGLLFSPGKYNSHYRPLLSIEKDLVLSADSVELAGKSDAWIKDVLRACCGILGAEQNQYDDAGDKQLSNLVFEDEDSEEEHEQILPWGKNPRLMIMLFLAVMMARGAIDPEEKESKAEDRRRGLGVGTGGIWSEYIKFLPSVSVPTAWSEEERALLNGTSLGRAVPAKMAALAHEYRTFQHFTSSIPWCQKYLWDSSSTSHLTLSDWIRIDAWFRSRVLELPNLGVCLIPFLDMVNHGGDEANAYYSLNEITGDIVLLPVEAEYGGNLLILDTKDRTELRINYGSHKSAAELLFSYGFIMLESATCLWLALPLSLSADDPLSLAKEAMLSSPPTIKLIDRDENNIAWISDAIWLLITNAEDGLMFEILQQNDGTRELKLYWRTEERGEGKNEDLDGDGIIIYDMSTLKMCLENSRLWEVYHLRAIVTAQQVVEEKLEELEDGDIVARVIEDTHRLSISEQWDETEERSSDREGVRKHIAMLAKELRERERKLLKKSVEWFEVEKNRLVSCDVVQKYLTARRDEEVDLA